MERDEEETLADAVHPQCVSPFLALFGHAETV